MQINWWRGIDYFDYNWTNSLDICLFNYLFMIFIFSHSFRFILFYFLVFLFFSHLFLLFYIKFLHILCCFIFIKNKEEKMGEKVDFCWIFLINLVNVDKESIVINNVAKRMEAGNILRLLSPLYWSSFSLDHNHLDFPQIDLQIFFFSLSLLWFSEFSFFFHHKCISYIEEI